MRMREGGLKPTACNNRIRAVNAYLKWAGSPYRASRLKEPQYILPTFTAQQVKSLIGWKPKGFYRRRLYLLVLILLDTGCRISEALDLHVSECDLDNMLLTVMGKGQRQRKVPFSFELRKHLFRYTRELLPTSSDASARYTEGMQAMARDVRRLCTSRGFNPPARTLHAFRHTFAVNYLRKGGSVFHLQKVLGHSSLELQSWECWQRGAS
jgi:integrase/recombinase XerD